MEVTGSVDTVAARERVILARQALYRCCAGMLLYPALDRRRILAVGAAQLEEVVDDPSIAREVGVTEPIRAALMWPRSWQPDCTAMQAEWVRLFGASRDGFCFPYEGAHRGPEAAGALIAELQLEYAHAGVAMRVDDLPDHVSVELEYMSYLCGLELEALRAGEPKRRGRIISAQRRFLERHLCQWLPALLEQLTRNEGGPFAVVCQAAHDLARAHLDDLRGAVSQSEPSVH